jgi:hypothetical protein
MRVHHAQARPASARGNRGDVRVTVSAHRRTAARRHAARTLVAVAVLPARALSVWSAYSDPPRFQHSRRVQRPAVCPHSPRHWRAQHDAPPSTTHEPKAVYFLDGQLEKHRSEKLVWQPRCRVWPCAAAFSIACGVTPHHCSSRVPWWNWCTRCGVDPCLRALDGRASGEKSTSRVLQLSLGFFLQNRAIKQEK